MLAKCTPRRSQERSVVPRASEYISDLQTSTQDKGGSLPHIAHQASIRSSADLQVGRAVVATGFFSSEYSLRCVSRAPRITLGGIGAEQLGADCLVLNSTPGTRFVPLPSLAEGMVYNPPVLTGPEGQETSVLKSKPPVEIENCLTANDDTLSSSADDTLWLLISRPKDSVTSLAN
jgi:hypothetical protein